MSIQSLRRTASCRFLITFLALAIWPGVAAAQGASAEPAPQNARMKRYGGGWECDRGYQRAQRSCVVVDVPPNAYLNASGHDWECNRAYQKANGACAKIKVPPHAFLRSRGSKWKCDRGYRRVEQSCVAIAVPENAYLDSSGDRWSCERGFRESGDSCFLLEIPQEGYIGRSGDDWECSRGYHNSTHPEASGTASEASQGDGARAWPSRCQSTLISTTRETAGPATQAISSRERLVPRTSERGDAPAG
jgi:hypothetical protein